MNAVPWADLALGSTVLLGLGALASLALRGPHERHRAGAATAVALLLWSALACVPLPRFGGRGPVVQRGEDPAAAGAVAAPAARATPAGPRSRSSGSNAVVPAMPPFAPVVPVAPDPVVPVAPDPAVRAGPVADPAPSAAAGAPVDLAAWARGAWLAGAAASAALLAFGALALLRILRRTRVAPAAVRALADRLWAGPGPVPTVRVTDRAVRPFCCGLRRAIVVLPGDVLEDAGRTAAVLRHEFAHVRHRDLPVGIAFALAAIPFWWHPLLWWLRARTRFAAELCADDVAAAAGGGRTVYARALIELATDRGPFRARTAALSVIERESDFHRRMKMLLARHHDLCVHSRASVRVTRSAIAVLAVLGTAGMFGRPVLRAQEPAVLPTAKPTAQPDVPNARQQDPDPTAATLARLRGTVLDHRFDAASLDEVAAFYARISGTNWVLASALRDLPPGLTTLRDFELQRSSVADALDRITVRTHTTWSVDDGIVRLEPKPFERADADPAQDAKWDALLAKVRAKVDPDGERPDATDPLPTLDRAFDRARAERAVQNPVPGLSEILDLANRAIEVDAACAVAELRFEQLEPLFRAGSIQRLELQSAEIAAKTARAQRDALRALIDAERSAIRIEIEEVERQLGRSDVRAMHGAELRSRLVRLESYARVLDWAR